MLRPSAEHLLLAPQPVLHRLAAGCWRVRGGRRRRGVDERREQPLACLGIEELLLQRRSASQHDPTGCNAAQPQRDTLRRVVGDRRL
jgi:hypothetical protein